MYSLVDLIQLSKINDLITIEATVDTGLESVAEEECLKKFGPELPICCDRGRVYFNIPVSQYAQVSTLRSVNNLSLVIHHLGDIWSRTTEEKNEIQDLKIVGDLIHEVDWERYLDVWKKLVNFHGDLYPSEEEYKAYVSQNKDTNKGLSNMDEKEDEVSTFDRCIVGVNGDDNEESNDILRFRVTCYRSGKHSFGSQDAARSFGGKLQDRFHWFVDLDNYELEIILQIKDGDAKVMITLTESSLHKRNIAHYGITTLKSTISFGLLQIAKPEVGELIMDPLCGSGAIPIEGASGIDGNFYLCGDILEELVKKTSANVSAFHEHMGKNLLVDPVYWDVCSLPLRNGCIDIVATDLPFGKRVGSKLNNRTLYPNAMKELARVVRPESGRAVLLTTDRTSYHTGLHKNKKYWRQARMMIVKLGGLKACVYLLKRTCEIFL